MLVEASADRNTCCDSSHRVIQHAKIKWYSIAKKHSQWKQSQGFSMFQLCLSQGCLWSVVFSCPSVGLKTELEAMWILDVYFSYFLLTWSFQPDWLAEEKGNIYGSIWSCCAKMQKKSISLTWTLIDAHHTLASRLIDIWNLESKPIVLWVFFQIQAAMMLSYKKNKPMQQKCALMMLLR